MVGLELRYYLEIEMNKLLTIILCFSFIGCAEYPKVSKYINPDFAPYYAEFESIYGTYPAIGIDFSEGLDPRYLGICRTTAGGNYIYINSKHWYGLSEHLKIALIFHELGHCLLGRSHTTARYEVDGCPTSLMFPYLVSLICYNRYYDDYIDELINNRLELPEQNAEFVIKISDNF